MKRTFIVVVSILILTGCSIPESQSTHIDYTFGVVETSSPRKYTRFRFYDINGKEVATRKISEAEVGSSFNTVCYKTTMLISQILVFRGKRIQRV
ncbi:lipoprotein [Kandleria vitulina]|uniref:lipoprotein n=1 Tax=Kandleria vitulina TaxID=1630 RepID=UPI00332B5D0D